MRAAHPSDVPKIMQALAWVQAKGNSPFLKGASLMAAELGVRDYIHREQAVIHAGFFIMVDIGKEWFSDKLFLFEKLVLKLDAAADPAEAVKALEGLALVNGCGAVVAGDALAGKMTPFYEQAGWSHLGTTLTKEITNVRRQGR